MQKQLWQHNREYVDYNNSDYYGQKRAFPKRPFNFLPNEMNMKEGTRLFVSFLFHCVSFLASVAASINRLKLV